MIFLIPIVLAIPFIIIAVKPMITKSLKIKHKKRHAIKKGLPDYLETYNKETIKALKWLIPSVMIFSIVFIPVIGIFTNLTIALILAGIGVIGFPTAFIVAVNCHTRNTKLGIYVG
jgi:hypothetical protein